MTIIHIQPALPAYRVDFFQRLAAHYGQDMRVYYSPVDMGAITAPRDLARWEHQIGAMRHPFPGVEWQVGALGVPVRRGDIVVVCGAPRNISTLLLLAKARMKGARTIWWGHYWSASSEAHRHRLRMKLSRLADALIFYTDAEVARFHADGWTHPGPVGALNNGIDLTEVSTLRRRYDPAERGKNLLFIGRLTPKAQIDLLIAAMAEPTSDDVSLHVIGDGPQEADLRAMAAARGVADRITWYGGTTDERRIAEVANRCAAFVYPGQVGLSLVHAMGYGLPCIVHNMPIRHMPEIAAFEDGVTGTSFCEGDAKSLSVKAADLLKNPAGRLAMSYRSIEVAQSQFNTTSMAERFITFVAQMTYDR